MVTGFLLGIKRLGRGANPHSQVPSSWKGRAVPPLTLWATVACYRVNFILYLQHYFNQQFTAKPFKKFCKTLKKLYAADSPIMFILSLSVYLRFFFIRRRGNYKVLLRVQNDVKFLRLKKKQRHKDTINEDNVVTLLTVCNSSKFYSANTPHTHTHTHTHKHTHTHTDTLLRRSFWKRLPLKYYCYHGMEAMPDEGKLERKVFCVESMVRVQD